MQYMKKTNAQIVLVTLHSGRNSGGVPLGAGCIASALLETKLFDRDDISLVDANTDENENAVLSRILAKRPQIVGFSLYCWNTKKSIAIASRLRAKSPGMAVIAGGPDAEWFACKDSDGGRRFESASNPFDAIFLGEGESSVQAWFRNGAAEKFAVPANGENRLGSLLSHQNIGPGVVPRLIPNLPCDAATLPSPWLNDVLTPPRGGAIAWELTRGCPFHCTYCYEGRGLSSVRHFPPERLEHELDLFAARGVSKVFVLDPTFNLQRQRTLSLLKLFAEKGRGIYWYFEIRAELLDASQARAFAELSCSLQIGLQSAHNEVLRNVGRDIDRKRFSHKIALLNGAGAVFGFDLIYGLPGDSFGGFCESLDYALSLMPNHLDIFPLAVLPGTALFDQKEKFALDCSDDPPYLLYGHPTFPPEEMKKAQRLALACDLFYTEGRAVPWFNAMLRPLHMQPSRFLLDIPRVERSDYSDHQVLEFFQCAYISEVYKAQGKNKLLPAVLDLVRYYGAWSRAFAEGKTTRLKFSYPLQLVESPEILDVEYFSKTYNLRPCVAEIKPTQKGPSAKIV